jgi:PAS domain S-box-containing protein
MNKRDQDSKALDLFLLMFNLSQLKLKEKIIDVFTGALGEIWTDISAKFLETVENKENIIDISVPSANYGYLRIDNLKELSDEDHDLLNNAVSMLAIVLEKTDQEKLLSDEKLLLQKLVDEKVSAFKESEEKFRNIFWHSIVGKAITTFDGRIKTNSAFCNILGYSETELSDLTWQQITHPDDIEGEQLIMDSILAGNKSFARWEKRYIHKEGKIIWVDISTSLMRDERGNALYFISSINDITEYRKALDELREKEVQYRNLANSGLALIWTSGTDKLCNYFNEPWLKFTGRTLDQELGNGWTEGVHPDDFEICLKTYLDAFDRHEQFNMEYRLKHNSGEYRWISDLGTPNYNSKEEFIGYIGYCFDITGHKLIEEELKFALIKYKTLFESFPLGITVSDETGNILETNSMAEKLLSVPQVEQLKRGIQGPEWNVIRPDGTPMPPDEYASVRALKERRKVENLEMGIIKPDNSIMWINVTAAPLPFEKNEIVIIYNDVTERKLAELKVKALSEELEQRVIQRTEQLQAANKELEAFSYSVSHDLRSPLRGIHGFTQILMEEYADKLDDEGKRICTIICDNSIKMGELIDDLLTFSRLGRSFMRNSVIDMKQMVALIYSELTDSKSRDRIIMNIGDLCNVKADPAMIKQVWVNLLSNAIKFSSKKEKANITVSCLKENGKFIYCVKDNGAGFNMKYIKNLFGVFQRLHNTKEFDGTGVGLAIVKRIINRHGGDVWAESRVDNGAEFYFSLPDSLDLIK